MLYGYIESDRQGVDRILMPSGNHKLPQNRGLRKNLELGIQRRRFLFFYLQLQQKQQNDI